jgi:hypothetical protein
MKFYANIVVSMAITLYEITSKSFHHCSVLAANKVKAITVCINLAIQIEV